MPGRNRRHWQLTGSCATIPQAVGIFESSALHRLFSRVSANWQGEPLETHEKILKFVRTTTTDTGLKVRATLNTRDYPKGVKAAPEVQESLSLSKHRVLPKWNYTITPHEMSN